MKLLIARIRRRSDGVSPTGADGADDGLLGDDRAADLDHGPASACGRSRIARVSSCAPPGGLGEVSQPGRELGRVQARAQLHDQAAESASLPISVRSAEGSTTCA